MPLPLNFKDTFVSIPLNILDIEVEEDLNIDKSKNFNIGIQTYLTSKRKHKEFTIIKVNLNIIKNDNKEHLYNEDDLYLKPNNTGHNDIIQINYIYNYYIFHLRPKATNNFFFKTMFKLIKKVYQEEKTRYQIFTTKITIYRTFTLSLEHLPIYIKKRAILEGY